ncbi:MAG: hypothetical protein JWM77_1109 [Rhodospirillales bacterium]|nr:hypothetical protein [Rhodospirillales bacterium]
MPVAFSRQSVVSQAGQQYTLSSLVNVTSGDLPEYLVLTGLDRDRYTAASSGSTETLNGNGHTLGFSHTDMTDGLTVGMVFTYTAQGYFNAELGYLKDVVYTASGDENRSAYLSLYGAGTAGQADTVLRDKLDAAAHSSIGMMQSKDGVYLGSLDIVTHAAHADATPNTATPNEIVGVAMSFIGQVWDVNGCWVLASNVAAIAGASLPVSSTLLAAAPQGNGEWIVAYSGLAANGAERQTWESQLRPGDIVSYVATCGGVGHIATVVSGYGYDARLLDNSGLDAHDGSSDDIVIDQPYLEKDFSPYTLPDYVVIYRLDTPVVTAVAPLAVAAGGSHGIANLFKVDDPAGKLVVTYQVYDAGDGAFRVGDQLRTAHTAVSAVSIAAADLASTRFEAGTATGHDTMYVRAFNGSYWGDWQSLDVLVGSTQQAAVVQADTTRTMVRNGQQVSLSSLLTVTSETQVHTYTIVDPHSDNTIGTGSGHIELNGAVNLAPPSAPGRDQVYTVSAADFAKLTYVGGGFLQNGEVLRISADNGAAQPAIAANVEILSYGLNSQSGRHFLQEGTTVRLADLVTVTGTDRNNPLKFVMIEPHAGSHDVIDLHGATNYAVAPAGDSTVRYMINASDLDRVTLTVGSLTSDQYSTGDNIIVAFTDGASTTNAISWIYTSSAPQITAHPATVTNQQTVALTSLFTLNNGAAPLKYLHIYDPAGGGMVQLNGAQNLLTASQPGEVMIDAAELSKVTYVGGSGNEQILIATSSQNDWAHWSAEIGIAVNDGKIDQILHGTTGSGTLQGGAGVDTAMYLGSRSNFDITATPNGYRVADATLAEGNDLLVGVERAQFSDGVLIFNAGVNGAPAYRLYQAAFARVPDEAGLMVQVHQAFDVLVQQKAVAGASTTDKVAGFTISTAQYQAEIEVAGRFVTSAEFISKYGANVSNEQFVDLLYQNVFGRPADPTGRSAQLDALQHGMSRAILLTNFSESAENVALTGTNTANGLWSSFPDSALG